MSKSKRNPVVTGDGVGASAAACGICGVHDSFCGVAAADVFHQKIISKCDECKYFLAAVILPSRCSFTGERAYIDQPGCGDFAEATS
jgi:hypothetical protein